MVICTEGITGVQARGLREIEQVSALYRPTVQAWVELRLH